MQLAAEEPQEARALNIWPDSRTGFPTRCLKVFLTLPFLHIHEPKENNRGAEASTLSMGTCGLTAMNAYGGFTPAALAPLKMRYLVNR